jgi:SAM-dependent MidA family methyltransferase
VTQGAFLERLGITARAQALARGRPPTAQAAIAAAHRRLTHPDEMGHLFLVLALVPDDAPPPPGFDP